MAYCVRVVDLFTNSIRWEPLPVGYMGVYELECPKVAILFAESVLNMIGEQVTEAKAATIPLLGGEPVGGILLVGEYFGVIVEGSDLLSLGMG
jgi:hypothetical protein